MNVVALVLGLGLGMGLMAVIHEVCRWDRERKRLAAHLGRGSAAITAAPEGGAAVPHGRHHRDDVDLLGDGFRAGLAAREAAPVSAYPAEHGWQRPSTMVPPGELLERLVPVWDGAGQKIGATA